MSEVVQAGGQIFEGFANKKAGEAQQKRDERNAAIVRASTAENAVRTRRAGERKKGTARLRNLSSTDVIEDLAAELELDALTGEYEGAQHAEALVNRGRIARHRGNAAFAGSFLSASGTLLGGSERKSAEAAQLAAVGG